MGDSVAVLEAEPRGPALQRALWKLAQAARGYAGVREAVTGDGNVTILHERPFDLSGLLECLRQAWDASAADAHAPRAIEIPVRYGGADLEWVAGACGLDPGSVIDLHVRGDYCVWFVGFQPGFAYLDGIDPRLRVPRRAQPRVRVPAGSVAIANGYTAVYPLDAPGGWHIIGSTELRVFDPARDPFALLAPGDRVRFVRV